MNSNEKEPRPVKRVVILPAPKAPPPERAEEAVKALHRRGKARGKHLVSGQATEIREMLERVTHWGGW